MMHVEIADSLGCATAHERDQVVAYTTVKGAKPPFYRTCLWMTVKNGFFVLGVIVTFAVLWQRAFGSVPVPFWLGIVVLGLIAGVISAIVNYMTLSAVDVRQTGGA